MNKDEQRYWEDHQVWTSLMGFGARQPARTILSDYLEYCKNPNIITDLPNICGKDNLSGFREHRWEQSVMSLLFSYYDFSGIWDTGFIPNIVDKIYPSELLEQKKNEQSI